MDIGVFNYGPIVIFRWQNLENWPVLEVSQNSGPVLGYADQKFLKAQINYADIIHPHDLQRVMQEVKKYSDKGVLHFQHKPYRIIKPTGEIIWVDDYTTVVRNDKHEIIEYIGYIIDCTQRIKDEIELKETKDRYDTILEATDEGVWDWDIRTNTVYFSQRWKSMLGYAEDEISNAYDEWESRVHPKDLKQCQRDIQAHLNGESEAYLNTHRALHKDGHYIWVLDQGKRVLDDNGQAYRMIGTQKDITHELELRSELETLAVTDALTGLLNRTEFDRLATIEAERAKRYQHCASIMMLDLDDFKHANDTFGHQAGDEILQALSKLLIKTLRNSDLIARFGGEEFIILLPETECHDALNLAERLRQALAEIEFSFTPLDQSQPQRHQQTVSIGLANYLIEGHIEQTIHLADEALYKAKNSGKNQSWCHCYDSVADQEKNHSLTP